MSMRLRVFGLACVLGMTGCGFRPVYAPPGQPSVIGEVYIDIIPNRSGQLLRQALQAQLDGPEEQPAHGYELSVAYGVTGQAVGMVHNNTTDRSQTIGTANWTLRKAGAGSFGATITSGLAHAADGADLIDGQFYYSDLNSEAIQERMATNLANQIVLQLAAYFREHPELSKPG